MGNEYGYFKLQNVEYPLSSSTIEKSNKVCDPGLNRLVEFIDGMLIIHIQDYWNALTTKIKLPELNNKVVEDAIQYDPEQYFQGMQYKFPLLAVFRTEEEKFEKTVGWYAWKGVFKFRYILPNLTAAQANTFVPVLKSIRDIVNDRIEQGYDPNYFNNLNVFDGYFSQISVQKASFGTLSNPQSNLIYPTLEMDIYFEEREQKASYFPDLVGVDGYIDIVTPNQETIDNFIATELI